MRRPLSKVVLLLAAWLVSGIAVGRHQETDHVLSLGRPVWETLSADGPQLAGHGPSQVFVLVADSDGPLTVTLGSFDFDAFLVIEDGARELVGFDDDGWGETHARIVFMAVADERYRIVAAEKAGGAGGEFWLTVERGEAPLPSGPALSDALIVQLSVLADRAHSARDERREADYRRKLGKLLHQRARSEDAEDELASARDLYRGMRESSGKEWELFTLWWEGETLIWLGRVAYDANRPGDAAALYEDALALFLEIGERQADADLMVAELLVNRGQIHEDQGEYLDAEACYEQAREVFAERGRRRLRAWALGKLGNLLRVQGEYDRAQALLEERLALVETLPGQPGLGSALADLGALSLSRGELDSARDHFDAWLAIAIATDDARAQMRAHNGLGLVHDRLGDLPRAREHHQDCLDLTDRLGDDVMRAIALGNLGSVLYLLEDYEASLDRNRQARLLAERIGDRDALQGALFNEGDCLQSLGRYEEARECLRRYLARAEASRNQVEQALGHKLLGTMARKEGDYEEACAELERAIVLSDGVDSFVETGSTLGLLMVHHLRGDNREAGRLVEQLLSDVDSLEPNYRREVNQQAGKYYLRLGELQRATSCFRSALVLARQIGKPRSEFWSLDLLSEVYWKLGEHDRSASAARKALALAREDEHALGEVRALFDLALASGSLGEIEASVQHVTECLEILEEQDAPNLQCVSLLNLGFYHSRLGEYDRARSFFDRSRALAEERRFRPLLAGALTGLARVSLEAGELMEARKLAHSARSLYDEPDNRDLPENERYPRWILARIALAGGQLAEAEELFREGEAVAEVEARRTGTTVGAANPHLELEWRRLLQDLVVARARSTAGDERGALLAEGFLRASASKGRSLLAGVVEHRRGGRNRQAISLRRELRIAAADLEARYERLARAIQDGLSANAVDVIRGEVQALERRIDQRTASLRMASPPDAALDLPQGSDSGQLRDAVLDEHTLLVEYAEGEKDLHAYVLTTDRLELLPLGSREDVARKVEHFLSLVSRPGSLGDLASVTASGRALFDLLLAPVLAVGGESIERVIVVPTEGLSALPFEALVVRAPEAAKSFDDLEFVLDTYEIVYGPSSPVLEEIARMGSRPREGKVLLLADPIYASESPQEEGEKGEAENGKPSLLGGRTGLDPKDLQRLPKTREEALAIADLLVLDGEERAILELHGLRKRRSGSLSAGSIDLHLGGEASRARLERGLKRYTILHLAAHGFVDRALDHGAGIALAFDPDDEHEGFLSVGDVLELDLDADLVVLSACDTARGEVRPGEGIGSMARAFVYAGARAAIASLWQVEDRSAAETMKGLYEGMILKELSASDALRAAKLAIRLAKGTRGVALGENGSNPGTAESGHPFFWAPFIYIGLPR